MSYFRHHNSTTLNLFEGGWKIDYRFVPGAALVENLLQVFVPGQGRAYVAEGCVENRLQVCAPGRARGKTTTGFCTGGAPVENRLQVFVPGPAQFIGVSYI